MHCDDERAAHRRCDIPHAAIARHTERERLRYRIRECHQSARWHHLHDQGAWWGRNPFANADGSGLNTNKEGGQVVIISGVQR